MRRLNAAFEAALADAGRSRRPSRQRPPPTPPPPVPRPGGRVAHDVASFTIEALPAEAFEALLIVATWLGEVLVDDPPYQLDVALGEPFDCWCRLDLVPDAGSSTVAVTLASLDGRPVPDLDAVRDAWVANLNTLGRPDPDPIRVFDGTRVSAVGTSPSEHSDRQPTLGWGQRGGGGLGEAVADGVAEAAGRGQHGDDAVGAGGVGGAQVGVEPAGVGDEVVAVVEHRDPAALAARTRPPALAAAGASGDERDRGAAARSATASIPAARDGPRGVADGGVEQALDVLGRDAAGAQQLRRVGRAVDDRALDADRARAAVEHDVAVGVEVRPEVGDDVLRRSSG